MDIQYCWCSSLQTHVTCCRWCSTVAKVLNYFIEFGWQLAKCVSVRGDIRGSGENSVNDDNGGVKFLTEGGGKLINLCGRLQNRVCVKVRQLGQIIWACLDNHDSWPDLVDCRFATVEMLREDDVVGMGVHSTYWFDFLSSFDCSVNTRCQNTRKRKRKWVSWFMIVSEKAPVTRIQTSTFFMQSEIWLIEEVCPDQNHDSFWLAMLIWQLPPEQEFMVILY